MTERKKVWAAPGRRVRDELNPQTFILDTGEGVLVPLTRLVQRQLRDGDLLDHPPVETAELVKPEDQGAEPAHRESFRDGVKGD